MTETASSLHWPIGIVVFFLVLILMNGFMVYLAVTHADEVVPSYETERR
ncbi:MAG: hypothetical protein JRI25_05665 [Deltaproteobacteria bacterium]|nr:hypothetical protein [Deltaproteobacteria bacterium]